MADQQKAQNLAERMFENAPDEWAALAEQIAEMRLGKEKLDKMSADERKKTLTPANVRKMLDELRAELSS